MSDEPQSDKTPPTDSDAAKADAQRDIAVEVEAEAENEAEAEASGAESYDPAAEISVLNDKLLRAIAEAENTRRIAAREKKDAMKYAVTNFARDILRVADNLGFAMMSVSDEARQADKSLDNLCVGIDMTMKELLNVFEGHGIKTVPAEGLPFDHNIHEAVSQVENTDVPANTVMQVVRGGFTIQDRLLRPAQVIVSTGGPKQGDAVQKEDADEKSKTPNEGTQEAYEADAQGTGQGSSRGPGQSVDQET